MKSLWSQCIAWIANGLRENDQWMRAHPYKACMDAGFAVFIGCFMGYCERLMWIVGLPALALYLIPSAIIQHRQTKKLVTAALIFLVVNMGYSQALPDPEPFIPGLIEQIPQGEFDAAATTQCYVIALIIIVIFAVWVSIHLKKLNDNVPPPPPPEEEGNNEYDEDAGYFVYITEEQRREFVYCNLTAAANPVPPTVVELDIAIEATESGPSARLKLAQTYTDSSRLTDDEGLKEPLAKWGLNYDPNVYGAQYAHNGEEVDPWESPISFHNGVPTISNGGTPYPLIIEQSEDLQIWQFLLEARIEAGRIIRLVDTSPTRQRFYRLRTVLNN